MNREKFETRLCELINKNQKTNFQPFDFPDKIDGIFFIQELYGDNRFQRFCNFGQPVDFSHITYKQLKGYAKACISAVKDRKMAKKKKGCK